MRFPLKFREHRLAEQGGLKLVNIEIDEVFPHLRGIRILQQIVDEQRFVHRAGHFRRKNRMLAVDIRLRLPGIPGVHGVSAFVHQGKDILQSAFEIHKDVRIAVIYSEAVSTGSLSLVLHNVHPALFQNSGSQVET